MYIRGKREKGFWKSRSFKKKAISITLLNNDRLDNILYIGLPLPEQVGHLVYKHGQDWMHYTQG